MSLPRFHIQPSSWHSGSLILEGDEAHHCAGVMRRGPGDEIIVFNGEGAWARTRIIAASGKSVSLATLETGNTPRPAVSLALLQAIPKGGNMEWIIEKSVELGVSVIHPAITARTVVKLEGKDASRKQEKWQRLALEACKQCGQNWLPQVRPPLRLPELLAGFVVPDLAVIAAIQEDARPLKTILAGIGTPPRSAVIAIGPEGDFTPAEYQAARDAGFEPMTLGPVILRVETAAMYCLSVLRHELEREA